MIPPQKLQVLVNDGVCIICHKKTLEHHYQISYQKDLLCVSKWKNCIHTNGSGAILRFCPECFKKIAGKDFMFDEKEYE